MYKSIVPHDYFSCLLCFAKLAVGLQWSSLKQRKMVLGSRPPGCFNKCMSCRPCMATLVIIHPHDYNKNGKSTQISNSISLQEDDPYYLLTWKCKCGKKLYHP